MALTAMRQKLPKLLVINIHYKTGTAPAILGRCSSYFFFGRLPNVTPFVQASAVRVVKETKIRYD